MRDWFRGESKKWLAFGVWSNGNPYGIPDGIFYDFPVTVKDKKW